MSVTRAVFTWLAAMAVAVVATLAACKSDPAPTVLQSVDLTVPDASFSTTPFDRNTILDSSSMTDSRQLTRDVIQKFFAKTPYSRPSFLETYQSNGIRASDAIANSAVQYSINPLVFVVLLETSQGLMGARDYVFPPERVEYVFDCGCQQQTSCLPELAGLDRQVDCLGRKLRESLDAIAANGKTAAGWGPGIPMFTLDGVAISPANDATATLYDWNPRLAIGKPGGEWVFWNVWNLYANAIGYFDNAAGSTSGKWIGDACNDSDECQAVPGAICATNYPNGMCVSDCSQTKSCPSDPTHAASYCATFGDGDFCATICNPGAATCRDGGACVHVKGPAGDENYICTKNAH